MSKLGSSPRSDIGPIAEYLRDITKLPPELVRPEQLNFQINIVNQVVNTTTPSQRVDPEYTFAMRRIKGFVSDPVLLSPQIFLTQFNVRDQGRARGGVFTNPVNMGVLVGAGGPAHDMIWDSFYAFVPGADMIVDWFPNLAAFGANTNITFGVAITGDLVRTRRLADGTLTIPGVTDR
jgi:hypothetical protein